MSPTCMICGFTHADAIVEHINTAHKGGLGTYLLFYPQTPVVSEAISRMIEFHDPEIAEPTAISTLSPDDRMLIVGIARRPKGPSTEIIVTEDF